MGYFQFLLKYITPPSMVDEIINTPNYFEKSFEGISKETRDKLYKKYRNPNIHREWSDELRQLGENSDFEEGI